MKKFLNLLFKEVKELITVQLFVSLLFTIFLFYFIGQMAKTEMRKAGRTQKIAVLNLDDSAFSSQLVSNLKTANFEPEMIQGGGQGAGHRSDKRKRGQPLARHPARIR